MPRPRCLLPLLAALLLPQASTAQSAPIVLPLDYAGRHLYLTLTDDHLGPLTLMLDTGFQHTSITTAAARRGQIRSSLWHRTLDYNGFGAGSAKRRYRTTPVALRSGPATLFTGSALVADFGDLARQLGHPSDGFLGWDFLHRWCATLDYAPARLTLRDPANCPAPPGPSAALHGQWTSQGLLLAAQLTFSNGRTTPALVHFDTGSDVTLLLNTQFRAPAGLGPGSSAESHGFGVNGRYSTDIVSISALDLEGHLHIAAGNGVTIAIARPGAFSTVHWWSDGPTAARINHDGVIGNGLLDRFRWTFSPADRRLYATPAGAN